jgi:hypothetical protein
MRRRTLRRRAATVATVMKVTVTWKMDVGNASGRPCLVALAIVRGLSRLVSSPDASSWLLTRLGTCNQLKRGARLVAVPLMAASAEVVVQPVAELLLTLTLRRRS